LGQEFRLRRRVQFYETDAAGIVHFSWYFRYFEEAEHALWREAGMTIHPEDSSIGWPRISASCEFRKALRFEQEIEVAVHIAEMTNRIIAYAGTITRDGQRVATGTWRIAHVSRQPDGSMRSADVPAAVAERLEPFVVPLSNRRPPTSA
jgi:YbgC/YbaW family acyl-CoA thioester hydrolase